ncbi:MAG TPA: ABC transporter permease [Bacteroidales bacterium]|nr:ABC transporter permease [Bacteroidales bacterium]MDD4235623.1 ABC transporter permease [Bacteroidales bacterium]HRW21581.1 ABC transporter permease [Bacteroidales bacterium]HXK81234.1 ABC transporter permease [Bacteroidales bacterium]
MRVIYYILQKEFKQIFRNRIMLPIIFVIPFVQTIVFVYAATLELKNADISIMDYDKSSLSKRLISDFEASPFFEVSKIVPNNNAVSDLLLKDKAKAVILIPQGFEKDVLSLDGAAIQININAIDGQSAGLINVYIQQIVNSLAIKYLSSDINVQINTIPANAEIRSRFWYNPGLNFKYYILPGILVILVTMMGTFLTALNLVREKEMGTIEQINVTPIKKWQFITGKLLPFWIIGIIVMGFGLLIGRLLYNMPFEGSISLFFLATAIYLILAIGLGLLVSDYANTQQQVMFLLFFFFLVFVLMSGIFTSEESMPDWAQAVNRINPIYYFMKIIRAILLKGAELKNILTEMISMTVYSILVMVFAVWKYRKTH